jgi:hypothetical protein
VYPYTLARKPRYESIQTLAAPVTKTPKPQLSNCLIPSHHQHASTQLTLGPHPTLQHRRSHFSSTPIRYLAVSPSPQPIKARYTANPQPIRGAENFHPALAQAGEAWCMHDMRSELRTLGPACLRWRGERMLIAAPGKEGNLRSHAEGNWIV